ncbi:MAG: hypothetical protein HQ526_05360 [Actinobacteria bacterium]|nr:hypothetical protein [Actinomycetota bacterium]
MGSQAFEVDECRAGAGSQSPRASDDFLPLAPLPSRFQRAERKVLLAANESALYTNLHIGLQRFQQLLERGSKAVDAANSLASSADDLVTSDSFGRMRAYMSGSVPQSFHSALDRAWPAKEGYGGHPEWWIEHFPKRARYPLPPKLVGALRGAEKGTAGLTEALQQYYSATANGIEAEQQKRLVRAKRSLDLAAEMIRFRDQAIRERVAEINAATVQLLDWTVARPTCDEFEIGVRIATDYLPNTLQSYLNVPTDETPIRTGGGKSARELTMEQLDLISKALDGASENHANAEANKLLANKRFLESRFGGSSLDIPK